MAFMNWKDQYSVGHAVIDTQHKELFALVNEVAERLKDGGKDFEIKTVIDRLATYTVEHFREEERLMQMGNYPRLEEHKRVHADLIEKVQGIQLRLMMGTYVPNIEVVRFLSDWLLNHIMKEDMDYKSSVQGV